MTGRREIESVRLRSEFEMSWNMSRYLRLKKLGMNFYFGVRILCALGHLGDLIPKISSQCTLKLGIWSDYDVCDKCKTWKTVAFVCQSISTFCLSMIGLYYSSLLWPVPKWAQYHICASHAVLPCPVLIGSNCCSSGRKHRLLLLAPCIQYAGATTSPTLTAVSAA